MKMSKKKLKKLNIWLKTIILALIIGFFMAFLYYQGIIFKISQSFKSYHFIWHLIFFFTSFLITLTIHELGHLVSFVINQVKIRALHIFIFIFYKNNKGWRFTIDFSLIKMLGGIVVPQIGNVENEEDYIALTKKFKSALIAGPNTTKGFLFLYIFLTVLLIIFSNNYLLIGYFVANVIWVIGFSLLYIKTFKLHNQHIYGDYVAYEKMGTDELFTFIQIYQYILFNIQTSKETSLFLHNKNKDLIKKYPYTSSIFNQHLYLNFLLECTDEDINNDVVILNRIKNMTNLPLTSKRHLDVLVALIIFLYNTNNFDLFSTLYMKLFDNNAEDRMFYQKLVDHKLGFANNMKYLESNKNDVIESYLMFKNIVDVDKYFLDTVEVLKPKDIQTQIICYLENDNYE